MDKKNAMTAEQLGAPDVKKLGALYQRAIEKNHDKTAETARQTMLNVARAEAAIAEARVLASFLDEV